MTTIGNDDHTQLITDVKRIAEASYASTFEDLFKRAKKELENALAFIELQKDLLVSSRSSGIRMCLSEIRAARSSAPRDCHIYFDELVKIIEQRVGNE